MTGWQWHQLDHMQIICTSIQTDNHASTSPLSFYRPDAFPVAQPTASKHWRQHLSYGVMKILMWHKCGSTAAFFFTVSGSLLCHRLLWQCGKAFKCKALVHSANINMTNQNTIAPTNHSYILLTPKYAFVTSKERMIQLLDWHHDIDNTLTHKIIQTLIPIPRMNTVKDYR